MSRPTHDRVQPIESISHDWLHDVERLKLPLVVPTAALPDIRLIRLDEINEEGHQAYRQALANVYASLDATKPVRLLYVLDGNPSGVKLYFGVIADTPEADLHEAMINLRGALEGQLPGVNFGEEVAINERTNLLQRWDQVGHRGVMLGTPTTEAEGHTAQPQEQSFQGIDRLIRALQSGATIGSSNAGHWQLSVVSQPLLRSHVRLQLDRAYDLSSKIAALVRTSVQASGNTSRQKSVSAGSSETKGDNSGTSYTTGTNEGASLTKNKGTSKGGSSGSSTSWNENSGESEAKNTGKNESSSTNDGTSHSVGVTQNTSLSDTSGNTVGITQEIANKRAQHLMDYVDKQLTARLQKGLTKGLFQSAVYLSASNRSIYERLKNTVRATFQGNAATLSPLEIYDLPPTVHTVRSVQLGLPQFQSMQLSPQTMLFHSLYSSTGHKNAINTIGSLLTAEELAIVAGLPLCEVPGIRRRKTVDFIVDLPDTPEDSVLDLGEVIDKGRRFASNRVRLIRADLNKHTFVTGVTGAGKTTTCLNLLLESDLPFLVIEPAKTEYRELAQHIPNVRYYRPNGDRWQSLRINPFALLHPDQGIKSHASFVKNVFTAVFPMEASMPMMVEAAILAAYTDKGWDIDDDEFLLDGDPFDPLTRAWPTLSDMITQLDRVLPNFGLGPELQQKYRGSLVSRLRSLTDGILGRVLNVPQSMDFQALLRHRAVIELEELPGSDEKALLMALLLGSLNQAIRWLHKQDPKFRQLTLVEEAHRLLSRPEPGDKAAAMAVESFADMLAEVRKYGAGLIIADQIPAKLIPDIIKNTHIKIVHRLFAEDDRRAMGEAMMMDEGQRDFLPNLSNGEAVIFCGGWHGATHAAICNKRARTDNDHRNFDLTAKGMQQLWHERRRYYPILCTLPWLGQDGDALQQQRFADFVSQTRQAHNHLLRLLVDQTNHQEQNIVAQAFKNLQAWHIRWSAIADAAQSDYECWRHTPWPSSLLAAGWSAVMIDANPCLKPKIEASITPLYLPKEWACMMCASQTMLDAVMHASDGHSYYRTLMADRELQSHVRHLRNLKTF